jgi:hypothetical protein
MGDIPFAIVLLLAARFATIRWAPPIWKYVKGGPWGDAIYYFLQIQYYRKHSGEEVDHRCLFRGNTLHAPSWYQRIVGRIFSDDTLWSSPWLPNFILFAIAVCAFAFTANSVLSVFPPSTFALAMLLFAGQADNARFDKHRIHYLTIQPRYLGLLSLSAFALVATIGLASVISIFIAILVLLVAINTSVFSRQVAYFVIPCAALLALDLAPLECIVAATLLSVIVNRREFVQSLLAQYRYSKWYFKNFYSTRPSTGIVFLLRRILAPQLKDLPPYMDVFVAIAMLMLVSSKFDDDQLSRRGLSFLLAAAIVCIITSFRKFASLGECWRYLSFFCYFLTPLFLAYSVAKLQIPIETAFLAASVWISTNLYFTFRRSNEEANPIANISGLLRKAFLDKQTPAVWWSAHYRYGSIPVALGYGHSTFEIQGTDLSEDAMSRFFVRYPHLRINEEFMDIYGVTHLLISKNEWPVDLYGPLQTFLNKNRIAAENSEFAILQRVSVS